MKNVKETQPTASDVLRLEPGMQIVAFLVSLTAEKWDALQQRGKCPAQYCTFQKLSNKQNYIRN